MLVHILAFPAYFGLAAVAALALRELAGTALWDAVHVGIGLLSVFCMIHPLVVLGGRQRRLERALTAMRGAQEEIRRELQGARDQAKGIHDAVATGLAARQPEDNRLSEVMDEVRVLQQLVGELSSRRIEPVPDAAIEPPVFSSAAGALTAPPLPDSPLNDSAILEIVRDGLRDNRVDLYIQPIVSLPQRKHRHYECFSRIRAADGSIIGPDRYLVGAEREGLIGAIDNLLLFRSVQLVRRVQRSNKNLGIFVNISEHSLADKRFFRDFVAFVADNRELASSLIFEFAQGHVARHGEAVMLELERLARLGFRFSMDQVGDLALDVDQLAARHFRFIKVDAGRLLQASREAEPRLDMRRFKQALERNAIDLIVEKIESEQLLVELLDHPIDYGQGFLFGEPKLTKAA